MLSKIRSSTYNTRKIINTTKEFLIIFKIIDIQATVRKLTKEENKDF